MARNSGQHQKHTSQIHLPRFHSHSHPPVKQEPRNLHPNPSFYAIHFRNVVLFVIEKYSDTDTLSHRISIQIP